jgi:hypothetical protein
MTFISILKFDDSGPQKSLLIIKTNREQGAKFRQTEGAHNKGHC